MNCPPRLLSSHFPAVNGARWQVEYEALLLDDPTFGLDPKASNEFSEQLKKLSGQGVAALMATHDLFRAKESGARVGIMKRGKLVAQLNTSEIGHADLESIYLEHMRD
jgi:ABC-2 type transport system ATP-binding protein